MTQTPDMRGFDFEADISLVPDLEDAVADVLLREGAAGDTQLSGGAVFTEARRSLEYAELPRAVVARFGEPVEDAWYQCVIQRPQGDRPVLTFSRGQVAFHEGSWGNRLDFIFYELARTRCVEKAVFLSEDKTIYELVAEQRSAIQLTDAFDLNAFLIAWQ
ncbi:MAG TPA: hypothetical protein VIM53_04240 [Candidatus Saccharimonadales bacterium]